MKKPPSEAVSLTHDQVEAIRGAARAWRCDPGVPGPPPDGQLEQIIEVMLGTSARIGEGLAIRKCDVDVTRTPSTVLICGTIVSPKGRPIVRQPHPEDDVVDQAGVDPELHGGCSAGAAGIKLSAAVDPVPLASTCPSRGACSAVRRSGGALVLHCGRHAWPPRGCLGAVPPAYPQSATCAVSGVAGLAGQALGVTGGRSGAVRNEKVRGSNPLSSTIKPGLTCGNADEARFRHVTRVPPACPRNRCNQQ